MNDRKCPEDKVLNVLTNRCVLKNGRIGRFILFKPNQKCNSKRCDQGAVCNSESGRCVKENGAAGRREMRRRQNITEERKYRDRERKERDRKDREMKEREMKERERKEREMKERERKEREMKERERKEREMKERERKERERKEEGSRGGTFLSNWLTLERANIRKLEEFRNLRGDEMICAGLYNIFQRHKDKVCIYFPLQPMVWNAERKKLVFHKDLESKIKTCKKRFFVTFLSLSSKDSAHANILFCDFNRGIGDFFRIDPHGGDTLDEYLPRLLDARLKKLTIRLGKWFVSANPFDGLQSIENDSEQHRKYPEYKDFNGYCVFWSLFSIDAYLFYSWTGMTHEGIIRRIYMELERINGIQFIANYIGMILKLHNKLQAEISDDEDMSLCKYLAIKTR